jgi:hypothetical protein
MVAAAGVSDRCANCGAPLASDQRYCVNCGERRGKARFSVASMAAPAAAETTAVTEVQRRPRMSSGATLIAFIGTLLLAVGLGLLIGHENTSGRPTAAAPPVQVVTVGGGGGGTGAATDTTAGNTSTNTGSTNTKSSKKVPAKKVVVTKVVAAKATQAASKVLGGSSNLAPPTVTQGGSCSSGQAGCQGGQFTGNFFGGG